MDPDVIEMQYCDVDDVFIAVAEAPTKPLEEERRLLHGELGEARKVKAQLDLVAIYDATDVEGAGTTIGAHLYGRAPKRTVVKGGDPKHHSAVLATAARIELLEGLIAGWDERQAAWEAHSEAVEPEATSA